MHRNLQIYSCYETSRAKFMAEHGCAAPRNPLLWITDLRSRQG